MAQTKLNNLIREQICKAAMKYRFEKEETARKERWKDLGEEIYAMSYSATVQAQMNALPDGFLPVASEIAFTESRKGGGSDFAYSYKTPLRSIKCIASRCQYGGAMLRLDSNDPVVIKYHQLNKDEREAKAAYLTAQSQLQSTLSAFKTVEKLLETWPDIKPFIPKIEVENRQLPVPQIDKLNETFNLPVAKSKPRQRKPVAKAVAA